MNLVASLALWPFTMAFIGTHLLSDTSWHVTVISMSLKQKKKTNVTKHFKQENKEQGSSNMRTNVKRI